MKTFLQYPSVWQTKAASFWTLTEPVSLYRVDIFHFLSLQDPFSLLFKFFQNRKDNASGKEGSILYQWQEVASIIRRKKTLQWRSDVKTSWRLWVTTLWRSSRIAGWLSQHPPGRQSQYRASPEFESRTPVTTATTNVCFRRRPTFLSRISTKPSTTCLKTEFRNWLSRLLKTK